MQCRLWNSLATKRYSTNMTRNMSPHFLHDPKHPSSNWMHEWFLIVLSQFFCSRTPTHPDKVSWHIKDYKNQLEYLFPGQNRAKLRVANINLSAEFYDAVAWVCHVLKAIEGLKFERGDKLYSRCSKINSWTTALTASEICRRCSHGKKKFAEHFANGNQF